MQYVSAEIFSSLIEMLGQPVCQGHACACITIWKTLSYCLGSQCKCKAVTVACPRKRPVFSGDAALALNDTEVTLFALL